MKKCTKKIPKHNAGAIVGNSLNFVGDMAQNVVRSQNEGVSFGSVLGGMGKGAATGAALGSVIPGIGTIIGGIGGAVIGGVTSAVGQSGSVDENTGEVTKSSGLTRLFGWGRSDKSLYAKSNRIKTSNVDKLLTPYMNEQFMSDPYNNLNTNVYVNAAEGGIVPGEHYASRREVEVAADGTNAVRYPWDPDGKDTYHVYTNPDGSSAMGNYVFTEEGVRRPNGEKYSDAAEKIIKGTEEGSKLRQIELRKLANEMEEQKMNKGIKKIKKGIPAHEGGENGTTPDLSDMFLYRQKDGKFVMQDINGNRYDVPEMMLPYIQGDEHGYWFGPQTGVAPSAGKWNGSMNFAKQMLNSKNVAKLRNTMTKVLPKGVKPATPSTVGNGVNAAQVQKENMLNNDRTFQMWQRLGNKGGVPAKTVESNVAAYRDASKASRNLWELTPAQQAAANASAEQYIYDGMVKSNLPYWLTLAGITGGGGTFLLHEATKDKQPVAINTSASMPVNTNGQTVVITQEKPVEPVVTSTEVPTENEKKEVVVPKKSSINKPSSSKKTAASRVTTSTAPSPEDTVVRRPIYEEPVKTVTVPTDDTKVYGRDGRVAYDYTAPETKVTPQDLGRTVDDNNNYTGSDWRDGLYRMAVLSQPLWDRAKAEPVDYTSPVYKYMPTQIDVSSQLRDADQSYALSRYNFANLYPNTGAGMAAGLQAASNRAKQYADIRQWQTNAQNELIGKNVGIYNNWANEHARILNDVYNKSAQNRAAARNINRQNRAAALSNWGTMLSDDKKMNLEAQNNQLKANILKPLIESVYENSDELIPMLAPYTMNRNVKKKSSTR